MKKGLDQKLKEDWRDIELLFELGMIDSNERGEAIHRIILDNVDDILFQDEALFCHPRDSPKN